MAIDLSDNIKVSAPKPVDSRYLNINNAYSSVGQVNSCIPLGERYIGLSVNVNNVEYWYGSGVADACLVPKNSISVCNVLTPTYSATTSSGFIGAISGSTIYLPNVPIPNQNIIIADISGCALINNINICSCTLKIRESQYAVINTNYGSISLINNGTFWSTVGFTN